MKEVPLNHGKKSIIDDEDYPRISKHRWCYHRDKAAKRGVYEKATRKTKTVYLHREVMNAVDGTIVDHIDGDVLNNQKSNLRCCTPSENGANRNHKSIARSGYFGVYWHKGKKRWRANITKNYREIHIGYFDTAIEAAVARDYKAIELFGEFATLNFPMAEISD